MGSCLSKPKKAADPTPSHIPPPEAECGKFVGIEVERRSDQVPKIATGVQGGDAAAPIPPGTPPLNPVRAGKPPTLDEAGAELTAGLSPSDEYAPYIPPPPAMSLRVKEGPGSEWKPTRRKAVVVGLNSWGPNNKLSGCAEIAYEVVKLLMETYSFTGQDIIFLHDAQPAKDSMPYKDNIMRAVQWLLDGARPGDSLLFCFVGAGLLGCDGWTSEHKLNSMQSYAVTDETSDLTNSLRQLLMKPLPRGIRVHVLLDTVSTISPVDLPHGVEFRPDGWPQWKGELEQDSISEEYSSEEEVEEPQAAESPFVDARLPSDSLPSAAGSTPLPAGSRVEASGVSNSTGKYHSIGAQESTEPKEGELLVFKGMQNIPNVGRSMESFLAKPAVGGVSFAFIQAVHQGHGDTYDSLLRAMRYALKNGPSHFLHIPELHSSHRIGLGREFLL